MKSYKKKAIALLFLLVIVVIIYIICWGNIDKKAKEDAERKEPVLHDGILEDSTKNPLQDEIDANVGENSGVEKTKNPTNNPTIEPTQESETEEPVIRTETPLVETKEPVVSTTEPTVIPTIEPTKEAVTKKPTVEPTKAVTKKPVITETPTKAPTKKPTIEPATKPTVKPTVKPTAKPVKTPTPTKKASKTYWYEVPTDYGFDYIESELPPDKYPVPDGYEPWRDPNYDSSIGAQVYWTQLLPKENVLAYNKDGSPDLKNTIVYGLDSDFLYFILDSKELNNYLKSKGIDYGRKLSAQSEFSLFGSNDVRSILYCVEYDGSYSNGAFNFRFDKNYNIIEEE